MNAENDFEIYNILRVFINILDNFMDLLSSSLSSSNFYIKFIVNQ